jgi:hypothetical protein
MTHKELEQHLDIIRAFFKKERRMRQIVFKNRSSELRQKIEEIDNAAQSVKAVIESLKAHMPQQATLLDAPPPKRKEY